MARRSTLFGVLFLTWLNSSLANLRNDHTERPIRDASRRPNMINQPNIPKLPESSDMTFEVIPPTGNYTMMVREVHDDVHQRCFVSAESPYSVNIKLLDMKQNTLHSFKVISRWYPLVVVRILGAASPKHYAADTEHSIPLSHIILALSTPVLPLSIIADRQAGGEKFTILSVLENKLLQMTNCVISKASDNKKNLLDMGFAEHVPSNTIKGIFNLALNPNASWAGTQMVRGIPCICWIRYMKDVAYNASIKACFTTKAVTSYSAASQVPMMLELSIKLRNAWKNCTVNVLSYKPGIPMDKTIFQPDVGTYCKSKGKVNIKKAPRLPDMFEFSSEVVFSGSTANPPWKEKISFNKKANLLRVAKSYTQHIMTEQLSKRCGNLKRNGPTSSTSNLKGPDHQEKLQSAPPLKLPSSETSSDSRKIPTADKDTIVVDDFALGVRYMMDAATRTCNITKTQGVWDYFGIDNPVKLIADKNEQLMYQGKKLFRKIPVHSWAYVDKKLLVHEAFFYMPSFTSKAKLVGISVYSLKISAANLRPESCLGTLSSTFDLGDSTGNSKSTNAGHKLRQASDSTGSQMLSQGHTPLPTSNHRKSNSGWRNPIFKRSAVSGSDGKGRHPARPMPTLSTESNGKGPISFIKPPLSKGNGKRPSFINSNLDVLPQEKSAIFVNIFDFDDTTPDLSAFDVSQCFEHGHQYRDVRMKLYPAKYETLLKKGRAAVVTSLHEHIRTTAKVQPTRISRMELYEGSEKDNVIVKFRLLAIPVPTDGTKLSPGISPSLQEAYRNLVVSTMSGLQIALKPDSSAKVLTLYTEENELSHNERQKMDTGGLSNGSVAGIGLAVLIVGCILGGGLTVLVYRFKRRSNPYLITG